MIINVACDFCSGYTVQCDFCGKRCSKCSDDRKDEAAAFALSKGWKTVYESLSAPAKHKCPGCTST